MGPDLEREFEEEVTEIVGPSELPGSKFMEELLVKMASLILVQKASSDPTITPEMQV